MKQCLRFSIRTGLRAVAAAAATMALLAGPAHAAPAATSPPFMPAPGWTQPYASLAAQPLHSLLQTFADDHALQLVIAADFSSEIQQAPYIGPLRADSAPVFLKQLTARYSFNWFAYENKLFISNPHDYRTQRIGPLEGGLDQARQALSEIGLLDPRFGWGELPDQSSVLVSGPAHYVELVRQMLNATKPNSAEPILMRFVLRYAPVDDREVSGCGTTSVIPGVASLLTKLITGTAPPFAGSTSLPPLPGGAGASAGTVAMGGSAGLGAGMGGLPAYPQNMGMMGMMGVGTNPAVLAGTPMNQTAAMPPLPAAIQAPPAINLVADVRGNAVLVRDAASRRGYYQSLLDTLDVPAPTVTIDLFSIEFASSDLPLVEQLVTVHCTDGNCMSNQTNSDQQQDFITQLNALVSAKKIDMVTQQRLITEDNQLVALTLERHFPGSETSTASAHRDSAGAGAMNLSGGGGDGGGSSDGAGGASRDTGDQFCVKPHQIDNGPDPVIELMLSTSLHEPIGALGETPESYTQRHLNTVLTLRGNTPMLVETDTLVPKMARQRALLLLVRPSQAGNTP